MSARNSNSDIAAQLWPHHSLVGKLCGSIALLYVLAGCAVGPDFVRPDAPPVNHYANGADPTATASVDGSAQHFDVGAEVSVNWWHLFGSSKLDVVIADAIANNHGLEAAQASLRQSQDYLRSGYGIFYPEIDANVGASRQKYNPLKIGQSLPASIFNLFTLSATVNYALDVFGGERRMIEGLSAEVDLARATEQATYLMLSSNIANTLIAKAAYRAELDSTEQLIAIEKEQVRLGEVQAQAGTTPYANVLTLRSQLASVEATIPQLEQRITQSDDLLATLVGHAPAEWTPPEVALADLALPSNLPVSLPSDLVRQRPDILAAEATAHAASASVGVATAAMFPSITLSGSYGSNSTSTGTLLASRGNFWAFGVSAAQPLFDGGTLWFKRQAAIDGYQQAMASYRQTVLNAFGQVADTLHALDHDAELLRAEDEALVASQEALHLVHANYEAGLATYLDVLISDGQYHQAFVAKLQAIATRYQDTVALFAAVGGGWWNAQNTHTRANGPTGD